MPGYIGKGVGNDHSGKSKGESSSKGFFTKMEERWKWLSTTEPSCASQRLQCGNQRQIWQNIPAMGREQG